MPIKRNIPNAITLGNLLCGCLAIIKTFEGNLVWASYFVGIALILDFFDGFTARLFNVSSPIGKDLDSLADLVTFGLVPGMIMFQLIHISCFEVPFMPQLSDENDIGGRPVFDASLRYLPYAALIIPLFSCVRLARFNNDTRQSHSFIGLPTPANAMVICSLPLIQQFEPERFTAFPFVYSAWFLCAFSLVMSLLLVANLPLFALKFKSFGWAGNELRFSFLGLCVLLLISLQFAAIPAIIFLYILVSIVNNMFLNKKV